MPLRQLIDDDKIVRNTKCRIMYGIVLILFLIIVLWCYFIQVIQHSKHLKLSQENMMDLKIVSSRRGRIFDRNGNILVRNRPSYSIAVIPSRLPRQMQDSVVACLMRIKSKDGKILFKNRKDLWTAINNARYRPFAETRLVEDIPFEIVSIIEEHINDLPGIMIVTESRREYPYGTLGCHVFGYLGEIPEDNFDSLSKLGYNYGDFIGVSGLEKEYEEKFRGKKGHKYVMVNAFGREFGTVSYMPNVEPINGEDLYLSIDLSLQRAAEEAFQDTNKGAVVAIDPNNGEILCLLSSPRFDPNIFTFAKEVRGNEWKKMLFHPSKPMNNRATTGIYEPGSTFKIVTAIAGLNDDIINTGSTFRACRGGYWFGSNYYKKCWKKEGHGVTNVLEAIRQSCDVFFYQLGLEVDVLRINKYAKMFGFGHTTGIDLPQEKSGEIMDSIYYTNKFRQKIEINPKWAWSRGMILNFAIGQGELVTPLQLANYAAGLANMHDIYVPHLYKYSVKPDGSKSFYKPKIINKIDIKENVKKIIHQAMLEVVNSPYGTGQRARIDGVDICGKTGTAQNPQGEDHALFIAFAPVDSPRIAVAIIIENAPGGGGAYAAPIAAKILQEYFKNETRL